MAAHHARMTLIPARDLMPLLDASAQQLADRFAVPLDQVRLRLRELRHPWPPPGA